MLSTDRISILANRWHHASYGEKPSHTNRLDIIAEIVESDPRATAINVANMMSQIEGIMSRNLFIRYLSEE